MSDGTGLAPGTLDQDDVEDVFRTSDSLGKDGRIFDTVKEY
jgi:hypothetical protein